MSSLHDCSPLLSLHSCPSFFVFSSQFKQLFSEVCLNLCCSIWDQFWPHFGSQNHPKSIKKGSQGAPGTSWGPFWKHAYVLGPFLERFFSIFERFWGPWGSPFSPILGPNFKTIFWIPSVIALRRLWAVFGSILGTFLVPFRSIFWVWV